MKRLALNGAVCISFPICAIHVFRMPMGYNQEKKKKINNSYTRLAVVKYLWSWGERKKERIKILMSFFRPLFHSENEYKNSNEKNI